MGMMTVDVTKTPAFLFTMGEENHDSACFLAFIIEAVSCGWLRRGDFLIINNAILHSGGSCDILNDFLWNAPGLDGQPLNIVVVPFPTRSPELNPIELNWGQLTKYLNTLDIEMFLHQLEGNRCKLLDVAFFILSNITHYDNLKNYVKQGYL